MTEQQKEHKKIYSKEFNKAWHEKHAEKVRERVKKWAKENPERVNATKRKWYRLNPNKTRNRKLQKLYGITLDGFNEMCKNQNGCCAICGRESKLVPDHDHTTKRIRAALCYKCNIILGQANDQIEILESAINYLQKYSNVEINLGVAQVYLER